MFMFVAGDEYSRAVKELFVSDKPLDVAIAFWGKGAEARALSESNAQRRIVCNLASGGTNPKVVATLGAAIGVSIRKLDNLHAKVIIGSDVAIVGSANFSANGLGLEDGELAHWEEAGYIIRGANAIAPLQAWFNTLWDHRSDAIEPGDIAAAEQAWEMRRFRRPPVTPSTSRFVISADNWRNFKDRRIYVIVWASGANTAEVAREDEDRRARATILGITSPLAIGRLPYDYYHDWRSSIHQYADAQFIDVEWKSRKKEFSCHGGRRSMEDGHTDVDGNVMDVLKIVDNLAGLRFGSDEQVALAELMNTLSVDWYEAQAADAQDRSFVVPLDNVLEARFGSASRSIGAEPGRPDEALQKLWDACADVARPDGQIARWIKTKPPQVRTGYGPSVDVDLRAVVCMFELLADKPNRECKVLTYMNPLESARFGRQEVSDNPNRVWIYLPLDTLYRVLPKLHEWATEAFLAHRPQFRRRK
jgi:PLD-like domain